MMNEEDELDDELHKLGIKEDSGEDSDITPTNSPLTPPTVIQLPQSSNTSGFFEGDCTRFSSSSDYDIRSDSSLSWGEDEFEGEATRIVSALFNQLDEIVYGDDLSNQSAKFPLVKPLKTKDKNKFKDANKLKKVLKSRSYSLPCNQIYENEEYSSSSSLGRNSLNIPPPSEGLINEIKEWVYNFPHLRVTGFGIDLLYYEKLESLLLAEYNAKISSKNSSEETFASDGDYENKLQFRFLKPDLDREKKEKKSHGPPSRICSGSLDPNLLKEHVLIKLFEHLWPVASQIIEPLLSQYAQVLINRSMHCSSISRGSSILSERELLPYIASLERKNSDQLETSVEKNGRGRVLFNSRPSSAMYRLPNKATSKEEHENLSTVLQISSKPLQFAEERSLSASRTRELSARSECSLPSLTSPGPWQRPVSSKSGNHLLTPIPTDQRPMSSLSFTRLRDTNKFSKLNRTATIEEGDKDNDLESKTGSLAPSWPRRNSFLPQIYDSKSLKINANSTNSSNALNVYGKSLSAKTRISKSDSESSGKCFTEPFVSWIVSQVEEQSNKADAVLLRRSATTYSRNGPNSLALDKAKRPSRSHH